MPNIRLYTSNRLDTLADQLADIVRVPLTSVFKPEVIVVQSPGMERWLSMQLAERLGIWGNCKYLFPNKMVSELFSKTIPGFTDERLFDTEAVAWQIVKILPECLAAEEFGNLRNYLADSEGYFKTHQLASRIADTFDQYLTYRPDLILEWSSGKEKSWQAELWRKLMKEQDPLLPPELRKIFFEKLETPADIDFASLPERISVFGISTLPEYHMDILAAVSDFININIFFMNPCREYWADIYPEKNIAKVMEKYKDAVTSNELHLEKGNSLLASMGRLGGDFLSMLSRYDNTQEYPSFEEPARDSLLHSVQCDILNMTDNRMLNENSRVEFSAEDIESDFSVRVNSCHSPVRELEVLYDNLLDMFNADPSLEPRDIIVMTPDIEAFSPYISAVFGNPPDDKHRIPFSIADKSINKDNLIIKTFFAVLDLRNSRFESTHIMDILENENVSAKFGLTLSDLKLIRGWIRDTNINWGIDSAFRESLGLPGLEENTWKSGLERMLLGYAMPGSMDIMYENILPYDIEGSNSIILGKFIEYFNSIVNITKSLSKNYSLSGWHTVLKEITETIFDSKDDEENIQLIKEAVRSFDMIEEKSGFHEEVELELIQTWLNDSFNRKRIASGFLSGAVTFCAMLPMRSIPFKVVCLIGMNDSAFPGADNKASFDLISQNPKRGDRSKRDDDRYLFLESIISAEQRIYISYTGQSIMDNSEIQPSVAVSELLDYIEGYAPKNLIIKNYIFAKHPLQPFSRRYFKNNDNIFSYSEANRKACMISLSERKEASLFIDGKLSDEYELPQGQIHISDLIAFFLNPAKHLLQKRLGIYLEDTADTLEEKEPFTLNGLQKYQLEDLVSKYFIAGFDAERLYNITRAAGMLPHGTTGRAAFNNLMPGIKDFSGKINKITGQDKLDPLELNIEISGCSLYGRLDNIWKSGLIHHRYANTKAKDRLKAWIAHLAMNASGNKSYPMNSMLICKDESWEMLPVDNSAEIISYLISIYIKGHNELIRFFPESSLEFASSMVKDASSEKAFSKASNKWEGSDYAIGEGTDPYYALCFKNLSPFNKEFAEISLKVFESMINHQKKVE